MFCIKDHAKDSVYYMVQTHRTISLSTQCLWTVGGNRHTRRKTRSDCLTRGIESDTYHGRPATIQNNSLCVCCFKAACTPVFTLKLYLPYGTVEYHTIYCKGRRFKPRRLDDIEHCSCPPLIGINGFLKIGQRSESKFYPRSSHCALRYCTSVYSVLYIMKVLQKCHDVYNYDF